jgi:predicted NAD/FAD-dependent oxidoreductase
MAYRVAVIGGGVTGAVCASVLAHGLKAIGRGGAVHLFDAGRSLGGRASTRTARVPAATSSGIEPHNRSNSDNSSSGSIPTVALPLLVDAQYDHGAQFFRASHPEVKRFLASGLAAGLVGQWDARVGILGRRGGRFLPVEAVRAAGVLSPGLTAPAGSNRRPELPNNNELDFCGHLDGPPYFVGMPTMQAMCEGLCERAGVLVNSSCKVTALTWHPPGAAGVDAQSGGGDVAWRLQLQRSAAAAGQAVAEETLFDHVVLATHSPAFAAAQLDKLLATDIATGGDGDGDGDEVRAVARRLSALLSQQRHRPARTLLVTFPSPIPVDFDAVVVHGSEVIRWIARDSSKPGRGQRGSAAAIAADGTGCRPEMWVAHATDEFASRWRHVDNQHCSKQQQVGEAAVAPGDDDREALCGAMLDELQLCLERNQQQQQGSGGSVEAAVAPATTVMLPSKPLHMTTHRWNAGFVEQDGKPGAVNISAEFFPTPAGGEQQQQQQQVYSVGFGRWDLSVCGDYFGGSSQQNVQSALLSGLEAASRILGAVAPRSEHRDRVGG